MFTSFLHLLARRATSEAHHDPFIREVVVRERDARNPRAERVIFVCWMLIAVKHVAIIWVCQRYPVPFHQLWINFPTWLLGTLATGIYFWRIRRG
ncbi:MAG: hypothetical protein NTX09_01585 [Verrucomicrobia bacterium]|nr:hypothetical protein [Verrucomicrobiota bacterium]